MIHEEPTDNETGDERAALATVLDAIDACPPESRERIICAAAAFHGVEAALPRDARPLAVDQSVSELIKEILPRVFPKQEDDAWKDSDD